MINTCGQCRLFRPNYINQTTFFTNGTCMVTGNKKLPNRTFCYYYKEGDTKMSQKQDNRKRKHFKLQNGTLVPEYRVNEIADHNFTLLRLAPYKYGKFNGYAVLAKSAKGTLFAIQVIQGILCKQLKSGKLGNPPYRCKIVSKTSGKGRKYYELEKV